MNILLFKQTRHLAAAFMPAITTILLLVSCSKENNLFDQQRSQTNHHSSDVLDKWMTLQLRLMKNSTGIPNQAFSRPFAYSGITAFESVAPGLSGSDKKWSEKWNALTGLPIASNANSYYFPANVNSALAAINRLFFPNASSTDKAAIDSLENVLTQEFLQIKTQAEIDRSVQFGKAVAIAVFNWADADGHLNANAAYVVPVGPGLWKPTPPTASAPLTPYWGNNRTTIVNSTDNTMPAAPPAFSTEPSSPFYQMVKQVYDASLTLTDDQKAMAIFWRDVPGVSSPGHWLSILQQVIKSRQTSLDKAALAYALTGAAINDALISCFKAKYHYNLLRPVTYIREVMGHSNWTSYIGTPAHPEYPSAHSSLSSAAAASLTELFGNQQSFTDHTYDYMGLPARTYPSFTAIAEEAGLSRFYPGIHFIPAINAGLVQGRGVTANIFSKQ